jgi:hypothetical protein
MRGIGLKKEQNVIVAQLKANIQAQEQRKKNGVF